VKILCLILSFYVVLLSIKPCCADNDCNDAALQKEQAGNRPHKKECSGCSPFFTCGSCVGFIVTKPLAIALAQAAEVPFKHCTAYQQPCIPAVSLAIWQPPQLS
jgi:predicted metal-binding protein